MNALDDLWDTCGSLAVRTNQRLYDWRIHSCTAGYSSRCGVDQNNSGTKTSVSDLQGLSCHVYMY